MPNVQAIPAGKQDHVSQAEKDEFEAFRNGEDNLYEKGIMGVPNAYDPERGSKYPKTPRPVLTPGPLLATDEGQPSDLGKPKVLSRERNTVIDRTEKVSPSRVDKPTGRVVRSKDKSGTAEK